MKRGANRVSDGGSRIFPVVSDETRGNRVKSFLAFLIFFVSPLLLCEAHGGKIINNAPRPRVIVPRAQTTPGLTAEAADPAWTAA